MYQKIPSMALMTVIMAIQPYGSLMAIADLELWADRILGAKTLTDIFD